MEKKNRLRLLGICLLMAVIRWIFLEKEWADNPFTRIPTEDAAAAWTDGLTLWENGFQLSTPFLSAPLYLGVLAVFRGLGGSLFILFLLQGFLWAATGYLLGLTAHRFYAKSLPTKTASHAALLATGLFLFLPDPWLATGRVLNGTLQLFLATLLWRQLSDQKLRPKRIGFIAGLNALCNPPFLLAIVAIPIWIFRKLGRAPALHAFWVGLLLLLPTTIHNYRACGEFIPISAQAGLTFAHGNNFPSDGLYRPVPEISGERQKQNLDALHFVAKQTGETSWSATSNYFFNRGIRSWIEHPLNSLTSLGRKLLLFFTEYGYGDIYQARLEKEANLSAPPGPVGLGAFLLAPALLAAFFLRRRNSFGFAELLCVGIPLLTVLIFFYSPRYRMAAIPICTVMGTWIFYSGKSNKPLRAGHAWISLGVLLPFLFQTNPAAFRPAFLNKLGSLHEQEGNWELAIGAYRKSWNANFPDAGPSLGHALRRSGREEEGLSILRESVEAQSQNAYAHRSLAVALAENGKLEEAKTAFLQAIDLEPADWESPSGLGNVYAALGETAKAESWYQKALDLHPNFAPAWLNLAFLFETKNPSKALDAFQKALQIHPGLVSARLSLAKLYATCPDPQIRNGEQALELLSWFGDAVRNDPNLMELRAASFAALGDWEQATATQAEAIRAFKALGASEEIARAQAALQEFQNRRPRIH